MRKCLVVLVAAIAVVAFSMPAMGADLKASGFYRAYGILSNFHDGGGGPSLRTSGNEQTNAYVAQRFRVKWQFGNENVKATWYLESDVIWGDSAGNTDGGAGRNFGGALGADKVQTETKQINVWFKIPDTSVETTVGIHTIRDDFSGVFSAANDAAGVTITGKYEPVKYKITWAKAYENVTNHADDGDLYQVEVEWGPSKDTNLGFDFYFWKDTTAKGTPRLRVGSGEFPTIDDGKLSIYMPGISGSMKAGPVKLSGWFFYQFGTLESIVGDPDVDINGFAIDARGDMKLGPGKFFIEGLYISGDSDENDDKYKSIVTLGDYQAAASPGGYSGYTKTHMTMLLSTWNMASTSQCIIGCSGGEYGDSLAHGGRGIWHIAAGYSQNFTETLSGEANIGYLSATKIYDFDKAAGRDKDMGTEINATVTKAVYKNLKISLTGGYLMAGDFLRDLPEDGGGVTEQFEDAWTSYLRVNYTY